MSEAHEEIRLARLDAARQALDEATSVPDVKDLRDKAESVRLYYAQRAGSLDAQNKAAELKLRAERRLGELLHSNPHFGRGKKSVKVTDFGIDHNDSKRWQRSAGLPIEAFETYLAESKAKGKDLTSADVARLAQQYLRQVKHASWLERPRETSITEQMSALLEDGKRFGTIYADPPWPYDNQGTRGSTGKHYETMPVETIARLPVKQIVEDDAHLHLWTTNAFGHDAMQVLDAWGFTYKVTFVWLKPDLGLGNYWRLGTEYMLLGVRGSCPFRDNSLPNWLEAPVTEHSAKPEIVARMIEQVSPPAYLELFGRHVREGWTILGNEIDVNWFESPRRIVPVQPTLLEELPNNRKKTKPRTKTPRP